MFRTLKILRSQPPVCEFMAIVLWAIVNPPHYEQKPDGELKHTHCTPQKCLHVDVFKWVWAWDRNIGAFIHYPTTTTRFPMNGWS